MNPNRQGIAPRRRQRTLRDIPAALEDLGAVEEIARLSARHAVQALQAQAAVVALLVGKDPSNLEVVATLGIMGGHGPWPCLALDASLPLAEAARTRHPIVVESGSELLALYPALARLPEPTPHGSYAALPLAVQDVVIGALGLSFAARRHFMRDELHFLEAVAAQVAQAIAQAIDRSRLSAAAGQAMRQAARAEEMARRHSARLRVLAQASRTFASPALDVRGILDALSRLACAEIGETCTVHLLSEDRRSLAPTIRHQVGEKGVTGAILCSRAHQALRERVVQSRVSAYVDPACNPDAPTDERSLLAVPLLVGGVTEGAIVMGRSASDRPFSVEDRDLLEDLAERAAAALQSVRSNESLTAAVHRIERASRFATRLQAITVALSRPLTPEEVAQVVLGEGLQALGADTAFMMRANRDGTLRLAGTVGPRAKELASWAQASARDARGPMQETLDAGQAIHIGALDGWLARWPTALTELRRCGEESFSALPLAFNGRIVGAIGIGWRRPRALSADDQAFVASLADQCAQALARAQLHEDELRARGLASGLQQITAALARALRPEAIGEVVLSQALAICGATRGMLYLMVEGGGEVELIAAQGRPLVDHPLGTRLPLEAEVPVCHGIRTRTPHFLEPPSGSSVAVIPLLLQASAAGALVFGYEGAHCFDPTERSFLVSLGEQCAQAIDRARLRQRELRVRDNVAVLARASGVLGQSLDANEVLRRLGDLCVPCLAHACAIELWDLTEPNRLFVAAPSEADQDRMRALCTGHEAPLGAAALDAFDLPTLRSDLGEAELSMLARGDAGRLALLRALGVRSIATAPLVAGGAPLGVLTFVRVLGNYDPIDVELLRELAHRAALALENARLYRRAAEAVQVRDDFLAIAGHELRTPLAALQLNVQSLQRNAQSDPSLACHPRLLDRLERSGVAIARLERLIEELLDVTRITSNRLRLEPETTHLDGLVKEVIGRFAEAAIRAGCAIEHVTCGNVVGCWDRLRVEQVLSNLLGNALKYGRGRPVEIRVRRDGDAAVLSVSDQGIGISPEDQARIFERFERAVSDRFFGGLGLGLWISRQLVRAMGGTISVESAVGLGSCFTVRLPTL